MDHVKFFTLYFKYHSKAATCLREFQIEAGVTPDVLHKLKREVPTRWHYRLGVMLNYLTDYDKICNVKEDFSICEEYLPSLALYERNTLTEFVKVLAEVLRVSHQLEADRELTISRTPRFCMNFLRLFL